MISLAKPYASTLAAVLLLAAVNWAAAQQAPAAPNLGGTPQQTSATYEDWILRCESRPGPPVAKVCEMVQFTQIKGQQGVLTQIIVGKPVRGQPIRLAIQVPTSSWLPTGVKLVTGDRDPGVQAEFKWCIPNGCIAHTEIKDDTVRKFRAAAEGGKLLFKDANQRDIALPVSFKGFGAAYDALAKE
jgi:invasion protein IalB